MSTSGNDEMTGTLFTKNESTDSSEVKTLDLRISYHAYDMAKERLSWKPAVLDKMAERAYKEGIKYSDTTGKLKRYIAKIFLQYRTANNIRIYGQNIYFFAGKTLITLYRVPTGLIKYLKKFS